jgi:pfkB family carbohydrate kinase
MPARLRLEAGNFKAMIRQVNAEFSFSVVATTLRTVVSASVNDWGAIAWSAPGGFVEAKHRPSLEIYDRVGGGDSFASGLIYGLLTTGDLQAAVEYGAAHGALAMTTPGDTSMASLAEVEALAAAAAPASSAKKCGRYVLALLTRYMACPGIRRIRIRRGRPKPAWRSQPCSSAGVCTCDPELR